MHDPATDVPRNTRALARAARRCAATITSARGDADDAARVTRLVLNRGIGVVFGGGGARGIAHIGVLRALEAHGVPIDATGGTSIGSIIAGAVARGYDADRTAALLRAAVVEGRSPVDVTLPVLSLAAGARVTERIQDGADGLDLEDAWRNTFCVSTNLTTGGIEIHRDGPGWKAIRASFAVPGVFPPVPNARGEVLVDGGLLDNLPVGARCAGRTPASRVIAIDVGAAREPLERADGRHRRRVRLGLRVVAAAHPERRATSPASPASSCASPSSARGGSDDQGDLYLRPRTDAVGLMDFKAFDELIEIGFRDADPEIAKWIGDGTAA